MSAMRKKAIATAILVALVGGIAVLFGYRLWTHNNPPDLQLNNQAELIDSENGFELIGTTNCTEVTVNINNGERIIHANVKDGKWSVPIDLESLREGWNLVTCSVKRPFTRWEISQKGFVNNIPNQASVYMPAIFVERARLIGNKQFNTGYTLDNSYSATSDYFRAVPFDRNNLPDNIRIDANNIPVVKYSNGWFYNPVTIAQDALGYYGYYLEHNDEESRQDFLQMANWLVEHQEANGAFPYAFSFAVRPTIVLPEGFISSMAQGQMLSVYARAYSITGEVRYLEAGQKVLEFMISPGDEDIFSGGSKSLEDICVLSSDMSGFANLRLYEEYVFNPSTYVLNGDLFALVGVSDWGQIAPGEFGGELANKAFKEGIAAIEVLLPYYDYYGWSSYDLLQYTAEDLEPYFGSSYAHQCHIELLHVLASLSGSETLSKYSKLFADYMDNPFWSQTEILFND